MPIMRLQSYLPMIAKAAWQAWRKLPAYQKTWIDVDDLIQDGVIFARYHVLPRFQPERGAKFTTYLSAALQNYYTTRLQDAFRKKRNSGDLLPIEDFQDTLMGSDETEAHVLADEALGKLLSLASPELRKYLYSWLVLQKSTSRSGGRFSSAKKEILGLSKKLGMNGDDFRLLLSQGTSLRRKSARFL